MKVSEIWLREWVNPTQDVHQLAALLTMAGLEVDAVSPVAGLFDGVIVAQVVTCKPHPQADKLSLCEVSTGSGPLLKIVCGATNVRAGLNVALAQIGANLPGGFVIKEAKLRGELSQGMLCSASELGLTDTSEGILELDDDASLGVDFREYLFLDDQVLDIDLTPNRADCLSVRGIAREVAALTGLSSVAPSVVMIKPSIDEKKSIQLQAPAGCSHYCGRVIRNVNSLAVTPLWMRERLRRSGVRSIHPIVDVTNYVMLELGQPMHAFDLDTLQGDIIVRFSHEQETLELLDGQEVTFNDKVLLITDEQQPLAIAGVMGGATSAVNENTVNIFLESAYFNPLTISGVARRFGLFTDSSQRYERGVDPALQIMAMERASALLIEITGGEAGPLSIETDSIHMPSLQPIAFNPKKVKQLTGVGLEESTILQMLQNLGMSVDTQGNPWSVTPPSHRFDIHLDVDLIEEVIRLYGYDKIPGDDMFAVVQGGIINPLELLQTQLGDFFAARSYHETISYSFVDPALQEALYPETKTLTLLNPISSELSQMRAGMWPGLIASMIYNTHRQQTAIKFFEHGVVFELHDKVIIEHPCIAGLITGEHGAMNWAEVARKFDFYDLKGDLQALFGSLQMTDVRFEQATHSALHPGKSAQIMINNAVAGWCGVLHPRFADALDFQNEVILFELHLKPLLNKKIPRFQAISKYPQIRRDLSFLVNNVITIAQINQSVRDAVTNDWLKSFHVFDVYTGKSIPEGKKSLAVALTLQDNKRTLVDNEINEIISAIIKRLEDEFAITLRD